MKTSVKTTAETKAIVMQSQTVLPVLNDKATIQGKADFFKALGDETRLQIIAMLYVDDLCMCEIVDGLGVPTSTISHHLKLLERGNVIRSQKEGRYTVYHLIKETILPLIETRLLD
ncbi:ArsR/SmtB family transcription factor [Lentibacillus saliphilus]|uniref:ArsR/SmtB family transcription factor n=1 Tax=Lentibacillus saliphilus TaxID=2737028 RepID=UPI001C2F6ABE|nr:metalloregulator ArsR/SmtB family transcription factor [Lentibacillus saliphilus]